MATDGETKSEGFYQAAEYVKDLASAKPKKEATVFDAIKAGLLIHLQHFIEKHGVQCVMEPDDKGYTAAHWACLNGNMDVIRYLIELGVPMNNPAKEDPQSLPIHWACTNGHIPVVDLLIQMGVSMDIPDSKGCTPLIVAGQYGQCPMAGYLMGKGAKLHLADRDGDSALHWAAFKGHSEMMKLLIYSGFSPRQKDNFGQTALHLACINGSLTSVKQLCEEDGAEIDQADKNGKTPYMLAAGRKHTNVMTYLKQKIARQNSLLGKFDFRTLIFGPPGHSKQPFVFFIAFLLFWGYPIYFYKVFLYSWNELWIAHTIFIISNSFMWITLFFAQNADPGFIAKNTSEYDMAIRQVVHFSEWKTGGNPLSRLCHTCRTVKPMRSKHCKTCNRCVNYFDHHCPWIYNCVGFNNRVMFMKFSYLCTLNVLLGFYFAYETIYCIDGMTWYLILTVPVACFAVLQTVGLAGALLYQMLCNVTTNESLNWTRYDHMKDITGKFKNPFHRGYIDNVREFLHYIPPKEYHPLESVQVL